MTQRNGEQKKTLLTSNTSSAFEQKFAQKHHTTDVDFEQQYELSEISNQEYKQNRKDTIERDSSSFTSSTKNVHPAISTQLLINPNNQRQWSKHYNQIQKIIQGRNHGIIAWVQSQKRAVVSFVTFGMKIGLPKKKLIQIANVSESSFKRWRKMYSN